MYSKRNDAGNIVLYLNEDDKLLLKEYKKYHCGNDKIILKNHLILMRGIIKQGGGFKNAEREAWLKYPLI